MVLVTYVPTKNPTLMTFFQRGDRDGPLGSKQPENLGIHSGKHSWLENGPGWSRCISYWKWWYSSNRYVSLLEGSKIKATVCQIGSKRMPQNVSYGIQGFFFGGYPSYPEKAILFLPVRNPCIFGHLKGANKKLHWFIGCMGCMRDSKRRFGPHLGLLCLSFWRTTTAPRHLEKENYFEGKNLTRWQLKESFYVSPEICGEMILKFDVRRFFKQVGSPPTIKHSGKLIWAELRANQKWITNFPYQMTSKIVNTSSFMVHFPWLS